MARKFLPDDFRVGLLDEAYRQHRLVESQASSFGRPLDADGAFWVVTRDAWIEFQRSADMISHIQFGPDRRRELFGLPVRVTFDDEPDVPRVQLVMEPALQP